MAEPAGTTGAPWRAVVEASTDALWLLDADGTTVWANRRLGELLGRPDDDLAGTPATEAFAPEARARVARHVSLLARATRGRDNVPMALQRTDGTLLPVLVSYSPVREPAAPVRWLHRLTPDPAAVAAPGDGEESLRRRLAEVTERERQLAEAQDISGIGSWSWDVVTDQVVWSEQLYRIYDLDPADHVALERNRDRHVIANPSL